MNMFILKPYEKGLLLPAFIHIEKYHSMVGMMPSKLLLFYKMSINMIISFTLYAKNMFHNNNNSKLGKDTKIFL